MNFYFDTSALAKLFFENEDGAEAVTKLVNDPASVVWVLDLAKIEFHSALYRRFRSGELSDAVMQIALDGFDDQFKMFHIEPMTSALVDEASALLQRYGKKEGLRTLDALQLAGFFLVAEKEDWCFVCADDALCRIADLAGYKVINPTGQQSS